MPNVMLYPGEAVQMENKYACYHRTETGQCKLSNVPCKLALDERPECGTYVQPGEAVKRSSIPQKLRDLIAEAAGGMLFVEQGDPRFTDTDLDEMMDFMVQRHRSLLLYIAVDKSPAAGEPVITVYEGVERILVD